MRASKTGARALAALILINLAGCGSGPAPELLYRDASQPVEKRVDDLLSRMTLSEKIGQLNVTIPSHAEFGDTKEQRMAAAEKWTLGTLVEDIGPAGAGWTSMRTIRPSATWPRSWA